MHVPAPLWSARAIRGAPGVLLTLHAENVAAGADVITAATFRTHARNLRAAGMPGEEAAALTREAVAIAHDAVASAGREVLVAGSVAPLEDCWRPDLVPDDDALAREHAAHAEALAAAGADLALVETMGSVRELLAAARAAAAAGLAFVASMTLDGTGRLLSGEDPVDAARALRTLAAPPAAIGLNCVPARRLAPALARLASAAGEVPLAAWGNAGLPLDEGRGLFAEPVAPADYAELGAGWIALGARLVGGCCGTNAAHVAALRDLVDRRGLRGNSRGSSAP